MLSEPCWYQQYPQNQKWKKPSLLCNYVWFTIYIYFYLLFGEPFSLSEVIRSLALDVL